MRWRRRREGGFTLLETLVALAVLGFLVLGLTHGVRTGLALWRAQSERIAKVADLDAAERTLRNLLESIPANPNGDATAGGTAFDGGPERLAFVGNLPTGLGTTRLASIELEVQDGRLVLSWTPHRHETSSAPPPKPIKTELVGRVKRLDIAYWGSPAPDQPAAWQGRWQGPQPPQLIRVRVEFGPRDRRHWPDLIAAAAF